MRNAELAENTRNIGNIIGVYSKSHQIPHSVEKMLQLMFMVDWGDLNPHPSGDITRKLLFFLHIIDSALWTGCEKAYTILQPSYYWS